MNSDHSSLGYYNLDNILINCAALLFLRSTQACDIIVKRLLWDLVTVRIMMILLKFYWLSLRS